MIYLSGHIRAEYLNRSEQWGVILSPDKGNMPELSKTWWAMDNGCFSAGAHFSLDRYLSFLRRDHFRPFMTRCLFATAPDVVGDAAATLSRSLPVLPLLREHGYPAALVAQNGLTAGMVPWNDLDCLFIGGTTDWKWSTAATDLGREARRRDKWTHVGRVNSLRRIRLAQALGYQSADGSNTAFFPDRKLRWAARCIDHLELQPPLPRMWATADLAEVTERIEP